MWDAACCYSVHRTLAADYGPLDYDLFSLMVFYLCVSSLPDLVAASRTRTLYGGPSLFVRACGRTLYVVC